LLSHFWLLGLNDINLLSVLMMNLGGMAVAAILAGGGAFFAAKANIERDDFQRSVQLISQDDDASWCGFASAPIIQDRNGLSYCAIQMPEYQVPEEPAE
jgi:hypothetical protein